MKKLGTILIIILSVFIFLNGLAAAYQSVIPISKMAVLKTKVINTYILYSERWRSGSYYMLNIVTKDTPGAMSIHLGAKSRPEAVLDTTTQLIKSGNVYIFHLYPAVWIFNGATATIAEIDYNGVAIYRANKNSELVRGIFICILGSCLYLMFGWDKKRNARLGALTKSQP